MKKWQLLQLCQNNYVFVPLSTLCHFILYHYLLLITNFTGPNKMFCKALIYGYFPKPLQNPEQNSKRQPMNSSFWNNWSLLLFNHIDRWVTSVSAILPPVHKILRAIATSNLTILQHRPDIPTVSSDSQIDEMCLPLSSCRMNCNGV